MDKYHVGTRLKGDAKDYIKSLSLQTSRYFTKLEDRKRIVPHMTWIRPFTTDNENELIQTFDKTLKCFNSPIIYKIIGLNTFEKPQRVLYAEVKPNREINKMVNELEKNLEEKINYLSEKASNPDDKNDLNLHFTISNNIPEDHFTKIKSYLKTKDFLSIQHPLYRVYLVKNNLLLREYDFALNESLTPWDALDPLFFKEKTIPEFRKLSGYDDLIY